MKRHLIPLLFFAASISVHAQRADAGLANLRTQIDSLDSQLIQTLAQRFNVCQAVGEYKKEHNIAVVQSNRFHELVDRLCKEGKEAGLSESFVKNIMNTIHEESVRQQNELISAASRKDTARVGSVELLKTSQSWDGVSLPDYLKGKPQLRVLRVTVPPHSALSKHHHDVMSYGVVNKGELTLVRESDGKETTVHAGEAVVETVGTVHHGANRSDETTEVVVFYLSKEGLPLSVADE